MKRIMNVLLKFSRELWQRLRALFVKQQQAEPQEQQPQRKERDYTVFSLRRTVLDELDAYFPVLRRMEKSDPDAFDLLSKSGIWLCPEIKADRFELSPWWRDNRPTFGAIVLGCNAETLSYEINNDKIVPRFIYFTKFKPTLAPVGYQRTNLPDVYQVMVYWDGESPDADKRRFSAPIEFGVAIGSDNQVGVLRMKLTVDHPIRAKKGSERGQIFHIPVQRWGLPEYFRDWAKENPEAASNVHDFLARTFIMAANFFENAQHQMTEIRIVKNDLTCTFNLDIKQTAQFFRDRDRQPGDRIFHIVRAHRRSNGAAVRFHFRGNREFDWHGYHIQITIPGLHKPSLLELDEGAGDDEAIKIMNDKNRWENTKYLGSAIGEAYQRAAAQPNKQSLLRRMWH